MMLIDIDTDDIITGASYVNEEERVEAQSSMKIGILCALPFNKLICIIPAIRALRNCYPKAEITLFGLQLARQFVMRYPKYFDHFKYFPGYPGLTEQPIDAKDTSKFINWAQAENFDLILQMQDNGTVLNPLVLMLNAKFCGGYYAKDHYNPNNGLFMEYPVEVHEVERHLMLVKYLGIDIAGAQLDFPLYEKDWLELRQLKLSLSHQGYVCIHPASSEDRLQWPLENFARLADFCMTQKLKVVIIGTSEELPVVNKVKQLMEFEPIIVAGKISIGGVGALINNAFALISNCTGVSLIAAALETPSVIIRMDGEPAPCEPGNNKNHNVIERVSSPDFNMVKQQVEILFEKQFKKRGKVLD
jgi:ADP-heptose:LPS heptosyltransferase